MEQDVTTDDTNDDVNKLVNTLKSQIELNETVIALPLRDDTMFATPPNYGISGAYVRPDFTTLPHQQQCYQQLPPQHQQHQQKQQQKQAKRPLCHTKSIAGAAKLISATAHAAAPITAPSTDSISTGTIVSSNTPTPIATTNSVRAVSVPQAKRQLSRTDDPLMSYGLRLGYTRARVADALRSLKSRHGGRGQLKVTADQLLGALLNCETSESDHDNHTSIYDTPSPASSIASPSRSSPIDDNNDNTASRLRPIVIDGNNVAISHGNRNIFSARGIRICVDYFLSRGHTDITVFLPCSRRESSRTDCVVKDQYLLSELEREHHLVYTPAKRIQGRRVLCYDDRYVLKLAKETGAVAVSNDHYRDLLDEFREVIENRVLMFSFVHDRFMPPDDPFGRNGPSLDELLSSDTPSARPCPYKDRCTYGTKCKYTHTKPCNKISVADSIALQVEYNACNINPDSEPFEVSQRPRSHTADEIKHQILVSSTSTGVCHNDLRRTSSSPFSVNTNQRHKKSQYHQQTAATTIVPAPPSKNRVSEWFLEADLSHRMLTASRSLTPPIIQTPPVASVVPPRRAHHHQPLQMSVSDSRLNYLHDAYMGHLHMFPQGGPNSSLMMPPPLLSQAPPSRHIPCYANGMLGAHRLLFQSTSAPCENQEERMGAARDKLFCELCTLFPADKVTEVMLASPLETSAQILRARLSQLCK